MEEALLEIHKITKMSDKEQKTMIRSLSNLSTVTIIELFEKSREVFFKLKQLYPGISPPILTYSALLIVISTFKKNQKMLQEQNFQNLSLEEILNLSLQRIVIFKQNKSRRKVKYDLVLEHWSLIDTLVKQKFSFRDISEYLKKYYSIDISYSTIFKIYTKIGEKNVNRCN